MKNALLTVLVLMAASISFSALALENKEFQCKNGQPDLPPNVYKITPVDIGGGPTQVPFVEIQRHFKGAGGVQKVTEIRGFAAHSQSGETDYFMIGQITLELRNGGLVNCRPLNN